MKDYSLLRPVGVGGGVVGGDRAWLSSCHVEWGRQRGASFPAGLLDGWGSRLHFSHRSRVFSPLFPQAAQPSPVIDPTQ